MDQAHRAALVAIRQHIAEREASILAECRTIAREEAAAVETATRRLLQTVMDAMRDERAARRTAHDAASDRVERELSRLTDPGALAALERLQ